jgi:phytoene dehydrogenase-like protein
MIHKDLAKTAAALAKTHEIAPEALPQLVVAFSVGIALLHRELIMYLWRNE